VTTPNLNLTFDTMARLEMLVVQEIWETETAAFWHRPGIDPKSISTEVILLPAAFSWRRTAPSATQAVWG
jgi:formate dehydrogenase major subunit